MESVMAANSDSSDYGDGRDILSYGLKNVKIELPQINIPNEVIFKHEIDRYMKLFHCKEKPARTYSSREDMNGSYLNCSEIDTLHSKPEVHYEEALKTSAKILNFSCTKCRNNISCQYCNYMASRKNYLVKHIITLHRDHLFVKDKVSANNSEKKLKTSAGLKLILKRYKIGASRKALWKRKKITSGNGSIGDEDGQVPNIMNEIQPKYEELGQSAKKQHLNEDPTFLNDKHVHSEAKSSTTVQYYRAEDGLSSGLLQKAVHGPTVLMVKNNKISVPANYSAKFMGFKVVDGKQHIVIKLLPTGKQNLPAGNNVDGVKEGSTECLQQTTDNFNLPLSAGPRETTQQMTRSNPVHSLISSPLSFSNQYSGKIKQENKSYCSWNRPQTVASPVAMAGKCATRLSVKPDSSTFPCDLVANAGTRDTVSWRNCIPQDHPQVLSSAASHMLHYDPMKKTFPSEFRIMNGVVNNSSTHNSVYCPSPDGSNQASLPFHNYSMSSKTFPLQSSLVGETTCFSQSALNLDKKSSLPHLYGYVNTKNAPVVLNNQPNYAIERQCCTENHHGSQYLNTKMNQMLKHVENSKQENVSNCVNSSVMPKITSVFSLQSKHASNYLTPEVSQSLQDVLQPATQPQMFIKTDCNQSFPNNQTDCKMFTCFKDPTVLCRLSPSPAKFKRERNVNCSTTNENVYFRNEKQAPMTSLTEEERCSASRTAGVGALLKTQTDTIITQQLAKDKMKYSIQAPNAIRPTLPEQKKPVLLQSSPPQFFVPLRLAHQQGLQVISGKPSKMSLTEAQATSGVARSLLLNKGPGMILTFGSGSLGTIANVTENSSQVLEKCASKERGKEAIATSEMELKIDNAKSGKNSFGGSECSRAVSTSSISMAQKEQLNITNSESRISSVKILAGYQESKVGSLESNNQQEMGQEQPVYALLPDGRQAVFLKCMSPNKSLIQNHNVFQGTTYSQNSEPKKSGAMQQKLFLKIKTFPAAANCQPVSNIGSSLPSNSMHSLNSPALEQKKTALSSSDALFLPGRLMPANACLASDKSEDTFISVESVHSSKHVTTRSHKISSNLAETVTVNKGSNFGSQLSIPSTTNKIARAKRHSKPTGANFFDATVSQKNRNLKRRTKDDLQEPPRKKVLHRKCKQKNQMDANELESLIQAPCRPRVSKDTVRILKLLPFNSNQLIKCPRRNQPVVVLNHPDADVPEVVNVMKTIAKFKGHVLKVSLSQRTIDALLEPAHYNNNLYIITNDLSRRKRRMLKPVSPVKERFVLKLTLKKTSKNNYQIVKTTSDNTLKTKFSCWFCGRIFDNQDNWVGHGQRHLMEATRDWNSLG
ncbi:hypothetical protein lerEdw1_007721 [Lerista edwardsae]|nr:hypothetical protein lerEdw1_007721 [Lerista edwardsae]